LRADPCSAGAHRIVIAPVTNFAPESSRLRGIFRARRSLRSDARRSPVPRMSNVVPHAARAALALACAWCAAMPLFAAPLFPGRQHEVGVMPLGLAVGDFDGDGRIDLATANEQSFDVAVLLG